MYYSELLFHKKELGKNLNDAKVDHMRKFRDVCATLMVTAKTDFTKYDLFEIAGDMLQQDSRLSDNDYRAQCAELGKEHAQKLDENFDEVSSIDVNKVENTLDRSGVVDPESREFTDLIIFLPEHPCDVDDVEGYEDAMIERINELVEPMNLTCTNCLVGHSPVCVLIGVARPVDVALFVKRHRGKMMYNFTNKKFDMFSKENFPF
ncbi:MAG: hypothetical protein ACXIVE_02205 [Salinarimonas sp.]